MKNKRFQYEYRKGASRLHKKVGEILRTTDAFKHHNHYQEYPVNKVNKEYPNGKHHYDWVIPDLKLVIECMGKQHYEAIDFSSKEDPDITLEKFRAQANRDAAKKQAALEAGYNYIIIGYWEEKQLNGTLLLSKIYANKCTNEYYKPKETEVAVNEHREKQKELRQEYLASDAHKEKLRKAREHQKERYKRLKESKDEY